MYCTTYLFKLIQKYSHILYAVVFVCFLYQRLVGVLELVNKVQTQNCRNTNTSTCKHIKPISTRGKLGQYIQIDVFMYSRYLLPQVDPHYDIPDERHRIGLDLGTLFR